ncbi:MAG TPA: ABC transporter permease, partial [Candidatus Saccharimonadales bacterium]|nr:ABC transporter permease [Candidatus Saccharimonadales bacterium]
MKRYFRTIWTLCKMLTLRWSRDPVALFFIFLFPLIFLLVFGAMSRNDSVNFNVAVINHSDTAFATTFEGQLKELKAFKVKDVKSFDDAKEKMGRGELDSILELPAGFGRPDDKNVPAGNVVVYFEESNPTTGQTVASVLQQVLDEANQTLTASTDPLAVEQKATKTTNLTRFDYTLAGIVGFSILSLAIFGMANGFPADKKTGALRRLRATPLRASQLILATALEYLFVGLLSVASMFLVASLLFDFSMRGSYLTLAVFVLIGIFCLFGFGLSIGGWAKNENQSAPLSNLVAFPMMFLSGVFFPTFLMPQWLQNLSQFLPLTPIIDGIRLITTENASLLDLGP